MRRTTMTLGTALGLFTVSTALAVAACGSKDQNQPPTQPTATAYPPPPNTGYYPPPPNTGYPPPQNTGGYYPPPTATAPPTAAPPATATMAVPGPAALPCQNDSACLTHRCNMQYQKCAFPCQSPADCAPGNNCMMGACVPGAPAPTQ